VLGALEEMGVADSTEEYDPFNTLNS